MRPSSEYETVRSEATRNDITAARAHALPVLYRAAALGLPTLADPSYQGAGTGIHIPVKQLESGELATRHRYRALRRRSQRARLNWECMDRLATRWLPQARIMHPWPSVRLDARTQGRSPVR